jgi:hypothetical protein
MHVSCVVPRKVFQYVYVFLVPIICHSRTYCGGGVAVLPLCLVVTHLQGSILFRGESGFRFL